MRAPKSGLDGAYWWSSTDQAPSLEEVAAQISQRDARDQGREVGALQMSDDAVHLLTDGLGPSEVIARIIALAVHRRPLLLDRLVEEQVKIGRSRQGATSRFSVVTSLTLLAPGN